MGWQSLTDEQKDGRLIQRWHRAWACPVTVRYKPYKYENGADMDWIEGTLTHRWPEEAFTPHWQPLPDPPS